jgi:hypothetical protein
LPRDRWLERQQAARLFWHKEEQAIPTWTLHDDAGRHVGVGFQADIKLRMIDVRCSLNNGPALSGSR